MRRKERRRVDVNDQVDQVAPHLAFQGIFGRYMNEVVNVFIQNHPLIDCLQIISVYVINSHMKIIITKDQQFKISATFIDWPMLNTLARFLAKIKVNEHGCWIWSTSYAVNGYGMLGVQGGKPPGMILAHRFAYSLFCGPIPPNTLVCHKCDVKKCVNPAHLFLGDYKANSHDAKQKLRLRGPARLTPENVRQIRDLFATGNYTMEALGKQFKIVPGAIFNVVRLRSHLWVKPTPIDIKMAEKNHICKKITDKIKQDIQKRYQRGEKATALARAYGVTASRVVQIGKHGF